ncbi:Calcium and integrin-binding protein 1 [Trichoplax sp. H2]|nr:Calcium and integrin-binding protein 1 [Trichoplax sp. H2]|eukprot:RDD43299.1 Calcium and integrin-binding protein 1 [Trichoplax sp. H2]
MMGGWQSVFTVEELEEYEALTCFKSREIIRCYQKWCGIIPNDFPKDFITRLDKKIFIERFVEIACNPFADRICHVFSSSEDTEDGSINFEDFLNMMSAFSEKIDPEAKLGYAFKIYDFNQDGVIDEEDIIQMIHTVCDVDILDEEEVQLLIVNILKEADLDGDGKITYNEFFNAMRKSPDFYNIPPVSETEIIAYIEASKTDEFILNYCSARH